ncbi:MAG: hypothetical protein ABWZ53_12740 [Actinomycetota bacterium]
MNKGDVRTGVCQPSTQVGDAGPRRGRDSGTAGRVGDGARLADGVNVSLGGGEPAESLENPTAPSSPSPRSQAVASSVMTISPAATRRPERAKRARVVG